MIYYGKIFTNPNKQEDITVKKNTAILILVCRLLNADNLIQSLIYLFY